MSEVEKIVMPYIGKSLSVNYYRIIGHGGRSTMKIKPDVARWMKILEDRVRDLHLKIQPPVTITLHGKFWDERCPDLSNLHKVIGDAIKVGLEIDDKHFKFVDEGYEVGYADQVLEITIQGIVETGDKV